MHLFKKIALLLFVLLLIFVGHVLISTGFFRNIEPKFDGTILKKIALKGAEDIMISGKDSFALISATDRNEFPPESEEKGNLFLIDLKSNDYTPIPLTTAFKQPFAPHGISFFKKDSTYQVMAINHTQQGHSIEVFELYDKTLKHIKTLRHASMISPNDLVMLDENRFYFTNDHGYVKGLGKLMEEYGGLAVSNVVYFDGQDYREVAKGIAYANGINFDKKRNLLYVASPRHFLVKVYSKDKDGSLSFIENIPCGTGVDNIEFDNKGNLWIGSHPNLLRFNAYAKGKKETSPSEIIKITYRDKDDYSIEKVYVEEGHEMSGSTVAATFGNLIFTGNVMDDEFLILKRADPKISK
ncbi:MAG: arylesterase/paraoxonase [Polaribacter sp.]|jgi:arylesterase/paraoxonase